MNDTDSTKRDFSRGKLHYEDIPEDKPHDNPLTRISEPKVPGVFRIRLKDTRVFPKNPADTVKKITGGTVTVGGEVGFNTLEKRRQEEEEKEHKLALLKAAEEAGLKIAPGSDEDSVIITMPDDYSSEEKTVSKKLQRLVEIQPCIVTLVKLDAKIEQLLKEGVATKTLDAVYTLKDSISWIMTSPDTWPDEATAKENYTTIEYINGVLENIRTGLNDIEKKYTKKDPITPPTSALSSDTPKTPTPIAPEKVTTETPLDVWSGWPRGTQGGTKEEKERLERVRVNFEKEFKDYEVFLKNPHEETVRKVEECKELIKAKNATIDALLENDFARAKELIDVFRDTIDTTKREWEKKISLEKKEGAKKQALEASLQHCTSTLHDLESKRVALDTELSELERSVMTRRLFELKSELASLKERYTGNDYENLEENILRFTENVNPENTTSLAFMLAQKEKTLSGIYGYKGTKGLTRSRVFGDPRLRKMAPKNSEASTLTLSEETKANLEATHKFMFRKNFRDYLDLYLNKEWIRDDPQIDVVKKILENNKDLVDQYREEIENEFDSLLEEEKSCEKELETETNNNRKKELGSKIATIQEQRNSIALRLKKVYGIKQEEVSLPEMLRETYSPVSNPSLVAVGRKKDDFPKRDHRLFDKAKKMRTLPDQKHMTDEELDKVRHDSSELSADDPFNRTKGMVRDVTEEGAEREQEVEGGFTHIEEAPREALSHDDLETIKAEAEKLEKKKHSVGNLLTTVVGLRYKGLRDKLSQDSKKIIACIAVALASGIVAHSYYGREENINSPQTAGEAVSWKDSLEQQDRDFLKDVIEENKLRFIDLMKKYAPSIKIDPNNPSTIRALSEFECKKLLDSPDPVYGLTPEQRIEVCRIVRHFEKIVQAVDRSKKGDGTSFVIPSPYQYVDHTMNLENFHALAARMATEEENKEQLQRKK